MASHPIGSKILEVNTDNVSIVIKGKSTVSGPDGIIPDQRISTVEIAGAGIAGIRICGEEIAPENGFIGMQKIAVAPLFFEQSDYQISVKSTGGAAVSVWHENRNIRERFKNIFERDDEVSGIVNFGNSVGYSDFEVWSGNIRKLVIRIEVYPTKISYKEDYRNMMSEISDEVYAVAFDFLKKTYQNSRVPSVGYMPAHVMGRRTGLVGFGSFSIFIDYHNIIASLRARKYRVASKQHGPSATGCGKKFRLPRILSCRNSVVR